MRGTYIDGMLNCKLHYNPIIIIIVKHSPHEKVSLSLAVVRQVVVAVYINEGKTLVSNVDKCSHLYYKGHYGGKEIGLCIDCY